MPYSAEINRTNPTCFVFLVDQSNSMLKPFGSQPDKQKAEGVADAINRLLQNLILKCAKSDGIRDYFYVGVIGYGSKVVSALGGGLAGQTLVPISSIANNPLRVEQRIRKVDDGAGGILEQRFKFPLWVEAKAAGRTPMCEAFKLAKQYLEVFLGRFAGCYPPLVINITDGMATDGDPRQDAQALQKLASSDGDVLLFNAHVSTAQTLAIEFPSAEAALPDNFAKLLFRMSSKLPARLFDAARADKFPIQPEARGFVFNADLVSVVRFLDIGTRVAQSVR
ncbi:MAG TPA: vWA domain-containing protein [Gemmataceae bacterium]|nr:vWA domain-containing protein [Gemmataceae bacterium]